MSRKFQKSATILSCNVVMMMTMIYGDYDIAPREQFWPVDNRVV